MFLLPYLFLLPLCMFSIFFFVRSFFSALNAATHAQRNPPSYVYTVSLQTIPKSSHRRIMRPREMNQMTGTPYFITGCALVIALFEKQIAIASILYLIFGDMTAALVGVSFGGDAVVVKLGREGKKSVEGSVGMFAITFVIGYSLFSSVYMAEYVALVSAIVATLTELWSEDYFFELNDNLTIPTFTALALTWALQRVGTCGEAIHN